MEDDDDWLCNVDNFLGMERKVKRENKDLCVEFKPRLKKKEEESWEENKEDPPSTNRCISCI